MRLVAVNDLSRTHPARHRRAGAPRRAALASLISVCALLCAGRANAHPEFSPITTNRYLKLDLVSASEVRLAYTILYGAGPALAERKRADTNADGRLDDAETRALGQRLLADMAAHLILHIDGKQVLPELEPAAVGLAGPEVGPSPFSVDLVAHVRCPGAAPHTLIFDDTLELPELGETEIRVEESPQTRLLESHRGKGPGPRESRILYRGPKFSALEDRSVTVRFEASGAPVRAPDRSAQRLGLLFAAALALLSLGGWLVRRRYRSMKG